MAKKRLVSLNITAMFPPENTGGVATHVNYLSMALNKLKTNERHYVHVVSVHNETRICDKGSKPPNLHIHKIPGINSHFDAKGSIPYESVIRHCMSLCNDPKKRPHVIHVHDFEGVHIAALLKAIYEIPIILTIHKTPKEWDKTEVYSEPKNFHLQALTKLDLFDYFIAPSKAYKQHLIDHKVCEDKIQIIHHGIPKKYLHGLSSPEIFNRLGIDKNKTILSKRYC